MLLSGCFPTLRVLLLYYSAKVLFSLFISAGKSFEKWEIEDICGWLTQNILEEHCGCFRENKVRGSTLLSSLKDGTLNGPQRHRSKGSRATKSLPLVQCSHKRIKCKGRNVWQRNFLKVHTMSKRKRTKQGKPDLNRN